MTRKKLLVNAGFILILLLGLQGPLIVQAAPAQNGICNGPEGVMSILVVGTDSRSAGYLYGMADSIMIMRLDFQTGKVSFLGIDRGIWVEIPDVEEDNGRTHGKITQAYLFGTEGMGYYSGPDYGAGLLKETIRHNWGIEIDHYIVVNMRTFRDRDRRDWRNQSL